MALPGRRKKKVEAGGTNEPPAAPIKVQVVPAVGTGREVGVALQSVPLGDVLREAGVSIRGMQFTIDGTPATPETIVPAGAVVVATEQARGS